MSEPTKLPSAEQSIAIARQSLIAKDKARQIMQPVKDRKKAFYENGCGNAMAQSLLEKLMHIAGDNELRADDTAAACEHAIEIYRNQKPEGRHYGNLADMANSQPYQGEPETAASAAAAAFARQDAETEANRAAAREALELNTDGSSALPPAPPEAVEDKPKRGRKAKTPEATTEAAPPPPPPTLKDDDEEEPSPTPRRQRAAGTATAIH